MARQRHQSLDSFLLPGLSLIIGMSVILVDQLIMTIFLLYRFAWPCRPAITLSVVIRKIFTIAGSLTTCAAYPSASWPSTLQGFTMHFGVRT